MVITSYGLSCFKVSSGDTVLALDPPSKKSKIKSPYFQTDIVLISHDHDDHNGKDVLHGKDDGAPFIIQEPGEYEYKEISIIGISSFHDTKAGETYGKNTIYRISMEDIVLVHLGDFGEKELRPEAKEQLQNIDVLFIPIGGESVLEPSRAAAIAGELQPKIVIPMHYDQLPPVKKKALLKDFFDEMGVSEIKAEEKLTFKKKDLPQKDETKVFVLEPAP